MKRKIFFQGTGTALITPFTGKDEIDISSIRKIVSFQVKGKVEALIPAGTTGESATLTIEEQALVVKTVVDEARGRAKVIAGAGGNSTRHAITLGKMMLAQGADAILSVSPYYNKPTQEGIYRHYAEIANAIDAPIIIYNVPGRTGSNIEATTTLRLAEDFPQIAGIKEASGNFSQIMEILKNRPAGFGLWSGDDSITLPLMALGADGVISVVSNEVPGIFSDMVRLCLKKDFTKALKIHNHLLDLMNFNFIESSPIPAKAALASAGLIEEFYRLPLVPLSEKHRQKMKNILKGINLR